jgi:osmotically-inducible protein OsmY
MRTLRALVIGTGAAYALRRLARRPRATAGDDATDATVVRRIRSDAFREAGVSTGDVEVAVEDGVATLEGAVASDELAEELVSRVAKTPGVRDVAAVLRVSRSVAVR